MALTTMAGQGDRLTAMVPGAKAAEAWQLSGTMSTARLIAICAVTHARSVDTPVLVCFNASHSVFGPLARCELWRSRSSVATSDIMLCCAY
jgi:hypothetical protein